ncbi:hypothetical protein BDB13_5742 [Rhodococcus sp. OK302]|nr:hypothetical protein BDB13_5742 [Rhodococcus sp. OK302]
MTYARIFFADIEENAQSTNLHDVGLECLNMLEAVVGREVLPQPSIGSETEVCTRRQIFLTSLDS